MDGIPLLECDERNYEGSGPSHCHGLAEVWYQHPEEGLVHKCLQHEEDFAKYAFWKGGYVKLTKEEALVAEALIL